MHGWGITCGKCGKCSDTELWIETPLGQKRPREHFQCPACQVAFIRISEPPKRVVWGEEEVLIPGDVSFKFIPAVDKYDDGLIPFKVGDETMIVDGHCVHKGSGVSPELITKHEAASANTKMDKDTRPYI